VIEQSIKIRKIVLYLLVTMKKGIDYGEVRKQKEWPVVLWLNVFSRKRHQRARYFQIPLLKKKKGRADLPFQGIWLLPYGPKSEKKKGLEREF